ncbi:hypothetical protein M758_7G004300 [Ceratodon purpureus]|nr:hypothetical protein M758_7G004300 [Ceratodon purpureus]
MECNFRFECRVWHFPISSYPVPFTSLFKPIPTTFSASNCGYDYDRLKMTFALRSRGLFVKQSTCKLWKRVNCDEDSSWEGNSLSLCPSEERRWCHVVLK